MFIALLFLCIGLHASEPIQQQRRNLTPTALSFEGSPTRINMATAAASSSSPNVFASPEEESELYDLAVKSIADCEVNLNGHVSPYLRRIVQQERVASDTVDISSVQVLRRLKSGELDDHESRYLRRLVLHAVNDAIEDRDKQIEESWSKTKSIAGMITTAVLTAIISTVSSLYSEKDKK
jgi:hypothetical protein